MIIAFKYTFTYFCYETNNSLCLTSDNAVTTRLFFAAIGIEVYVTTGSVQSQAPRRAHLQTQYPAGISVHDVNKCCITGVQSHSGVVNIKARTSWIQS